MSDETPQPPAPTHCTCGTKLVPNAVFCHMCGRPVGEPPRAEEPVLVPPLMPQPEERARALPPPIGFGNPEALRAAAVSASMATVAAVLTAVPALTFLWFFLAGGYAVMLYNRRVGTPPAPAAGARLGWMAGVFISVLLLITITIEVLTSGDTLFAEIKKAAATVQLDAEAKAQFQKLIEDPSYMAFVTLVSACLGFLFISALTTMGGFFGTRFFLNKK